MNYSFNWSAVSGGAPYITISSLGISFNSVSIEKLKNPEKILIGFDEENMMLGIKEYQGEENTKPYEFASRVKQGWIRIGCKDFINYLTTLAKFDFSKATKFTAEFDKDTNMLLVDIKNGLLRMKNENNKKKTAESLD